MVLIFIYYMIRLKDLLCEDPDGVTVDGEYYDFKEASHTFLIYDDVKDKKQYWVAYVYPEYRKGGRAILCENAELESILNGDDNEYIRKYIDSNLQRFPSHSKLTWILEIADRITSATNVVTYCNGRLYFSKYITFWQDNNVVVSYKSKISDFFNRIGVSTADVFVEDRIRSDKMVPFNEFFGGIHQELNAFEKAKLELAKKLHMDKGKLDKAVLDVLRSKPKDMETLYARLEDKFNMPLLQIKRIFRNIPLGKLVAKELKEYINKINNK